MYAKQFFLDKEPGLKASRTSFSTRRLARVYVQQGTLDNGIFVYVLNSCGLVKVVKKKYCQISRTLEQIKPFKENLSRKTCSSALDSRGLICSLRSRRFPVWCGRRGENAGPNSYEKSVLLRQNVGLNYYCYTLKLCC